MSVRDDLLRWVGGLLAGTSEGTAAPAEESVRCYTFVPIVGGQHVPQARQVHWFKRRGHPASPVCLRCGAPNPRLRTAVEA